MRIRLKPLRDQVIVITGATSGIGLALARKAAAQGARLVLAARNEEVLKSTTEEIIASGGEAVPVVADVGQAEDVQRICDITLQRFGGFDTWVNNAGVSTYGPVLEVPLEDQRRVFDTNYWGVVHGSLVAARYLREHGGALINIGSTLSDRAVPIQGPYSASKHAVKGFTDALRMELEQEKAPVSVTLIKPSTIDTPYIEHAKNFLDQPPTNPPPIYAAELVADAVLHAAQHPLRDLVVGGGARLVSLAGKLAPRLTDRLMEGSASRMQRSSTPVRRGRDALYQPGQDGHVHGHYPAPVFQHSLYTSASKHPALTATLMAAAGLLLWAVFSKPER